MNLISFFLQATPVAIDTLNNAAQTTTEQEKLSVLDLMMKGGVLMIPILLLSLVAVYIFVERYLTISKAGRIEPTFLPSIADRLQHGDVKSAIHQCKSTNLPIARILERGLSRIGTPKREIEDSMETMAKVEVYKLEKGLNILAAVASIAPMFGFLGTVVGMITAFHQIALSDTISIGVIAGGIYVKMVSSASGLIVGVMAHMFHTILNSMIDRTVNKMELTAINFMDVLHQPVAA
ncbi:MAG: MotA/TolQ/ExbB proton channel family protein [Chitinophagales bacterium]|nr:MotA/TolQ/ExbB proton channel family protein [Chitinophagales bacterium]